METTSPRTRILEKRFIFFAVCLAVALIATVLRFFWLQSFKDNARETSFRLAQELGFHVANTGKIDDSAWKQFEGKYSNIVFLGYEYFPLEKEAFYSNRKQWSALKKEDQQAMQLLSSQALLKNYTAFKNKHSQEHLHIVRANLLPAESNQPGVAIGAVNVAYMLPGQTAIINLGRAFLYVLWALYALSSLAFANIVLKPLLMGKRISSRQSNSYKSSDSFASNKNAFEYDKDDLEVQWIEDEMGKTEPIFVDEFGKSWNILLADGGDMTSWQQKGQWYSSGDDLIAKPWGSSAIKKDHKISAEYFYQLKACKMAGQDAFVILFPVSDYYLTWVIGAWNNTRSELAGFAQTSKEFKVDKNRWYLIEVQVSAQEVKGSVNGETAWTLPRKDIKQSSPDIGFEKGLGMGVWSGLCRYTDVRFRGVYYNV